MTIVENGEVRPTRKENMLKILHTLPCLIMIGPRYNITESSREKREASNGLVACHVEFLQNFN